MNQIPPTSRTESATSLDRIAFLSAISTSILAAVSLGMAVSTLPRTGPFAAVGSAIPYPYSAAAKFVPRDFLWMYPSLLMMLAFLVLATSLRLRGDDLRQIYGSVGQGLAVSSFIVISIDYFIQLRTVQPSLRRGESDGLAIISQYNPHGVFIALEELGFLLMGLSFAFLAFTLGHSRLERNIRRVFLIASVLLVGTFVGMSLYFGLGLEYRFEVSAISITWLTLIVSGAMLAKLFYRPNRP